MCSGQFTHDTLFCFFAKHSFSSLVELWEMKMQFLPVLLGVMFWECVWCFLCVNGAYVTCM